MNKQRPVNLDLTTIKFPLPAIISILHRISGLILFLLIPLALCGLSLSLRSPEDFQAVAELMKQSWFKILVDLMLAALLYHLIAGIRHMVMDLGYGETLAAGRFSSKLILVLFILTTIVVSILLW